MIDAVAIVAGLASLVTIVLCLRALFHDPGERARPRADRADLGGTVAYDYTRRPAAEVQVWADRNAGRFDSALAGPGMRAGSHEASPGPATLASQPVLHHDEYALPQRWHPRPPAVPARPVTAGLHTATLVIFAAAVVQQHAWRAEVLAVFPPDRPWPGDDTLWRGMRAIEGGA